MFDLATLPLGLPSKQRPDDVPFKHSRARTLIAGRVLTSDSHMNWTKAPMV